MRTLVVLTLFAAHATGPGAIPGATAGAAGTAGVPAPRPPLLYVANQGGASITVIDMSADSVVRTIDLTVLGFTADARPHHVAVEPDGSFVYVSLIGDGFVAKLTPEGELRGKAEFEAPGLLALDPHSDRLWVGRSMMAVSPPERLGVIDRDDMSIDEVGVFFARPHALALSTDGRLVYAASLAENRMAVLFPEDEGIELLAVDGPTHVLVQFAVSPDGRWLAAGGEMNGKLLLFDLAFPSRPRGVASIDVAPKPWHPVFSPDGERLYVGNLGANVVTVVRTADWSVEKVIAHSAFAEPHGIALSPDGARLYVGNRNVQGPGAGRGRVVVIDTRSLEVVKVLDTGPYAAGMGTATPLR